MTSYDFLKDLKDCRFVDDLPTDKYTSFKIGPPARLAAFPQTEKAAAELIKRLHESKVRFMTVGNCSNVLFCGECYDGVLLFTKELCRISVEGDTLRFGAGVPLTAAALKAKALSLTGLEFAYGIPGSFGGGVFMNAGAYGGQLSDIVCESTVCDEGGRIFTLSASEHLFGYRQSVFQKEKLFVLDTAVRLSQGDKNEIGARMDELMRCRKEKQPLEYPSAGSVFKRGDGFITARLIDECGLKGLCVGGAQVSEKHAGFIINTGDATAKDVVELIEKIKDEVRRLCQKELECEIQIIGGGNI